MALVTRQLFSADDNQAVITYTYDDAQANLITAFHATNASPQAIEFEIRDVNTNALLFSGNIVPQGRPANPPTTLAPGDYDVSAQGLHMVSKTVMGNTQLVLPANVSCRWPA